jgi:hypothetical protein
MGHIILLNITENFFQSKTSLKDTTTAKKINQNTTYKEKHVIVQAQEMFVCLYVDDILFTGNHPTMIQDFKQSMVKEFEMTNLDLMAYFLGLDVEQYSDGIFISQAKYAIEVLKKFTMKYYCPADNPIEYRTKLTKEGDLVNPTYYKSIVGCLRYLTCTRLDILFGVGLIS